jgi:eukaryotic-like serine/threonine-protein kinase
MVLVAADSQLCRRLAAGGMGQVWLAVDQVLDRPVAVKLPRDDAQDRSLRSRRLRTEACRAAAVSHPGIAGVFDYGETTADSAGLTPYLVMELVDGEPLSVLLAREGRLGLRRSLEIVGQAAIALGAAHRAGLVHRDVKPSNLLLRADGVVKVIDFGVAQPLGEQADAASGTVGYLAPQQAVGQPATAASDIYGLGVVAYECLAGRRPFTGEHPIAVALAHLLQAPPPLPDDIPAAVRALAGRRWPRSLGVGLPTRRCLAGNCWRCAEA